MSKNCIGSNYAITATAKLANSNIGILKTFKKLNTPAMKANKNGTINNLKCL
jgi:hypothetical protein